MSKNRQQKEFDHISDTLTKALSYIISGSLRVDVDNQTELELSGHTKGKNEVSINIEEHRDRLLTAPLVRLLTAALIDEDYDGEKLGLLDRLSNARRFANSLVNNDLTLSLLYDGKEVMILGKDAKPKLSRIVTRSSHIQIKNLQTLRKLDKELER